jgi:tripartite-type tricarboxylate transporter receptor subunit TctC
MTHLRKITLLLASALVSILVVTGLCIGAEKYPARPIQVIVPFAPGGAADRTARVVEIFWAKYSPQPMLIIDKPGAGGVLGEEYVVRSKPDGYTLLFAQGAGHDLVMPHLLKMPYDPLKDLIPVARITIHSVVICVGGKSPINSMQDLIAWQKKGNKVTAAVSTAAGAVDLVMRAISKRADIEIVTVPFTGGGESTVALAGGHLTIGGGHPTEVMPHILSGRFKPIGVALDQRDPVLPNVPTLKEQGIDVATWGAVNGIGAPVGTPPEVIEYISSTLQKVSVDAEYKKRMASIYNANRYMNTKEWTTFFREAYKDYGDLIEELGIKI